MKTERRHELQTNVLADWLGHHVEQLRPHSKTITIAVAAVIITALVGAYMVSFQATQASAGWSDYYAAVFEQSSERLETVAQIHSGTLPAVWARLSEADLELAQGMQMLLFGVSPSDPAMFVLIVMVLVGTGTLASFIPARRATRIDPVAALRYE